MGLTRFGVGGSDAHGLRPIGAFVTLAPGDDKKTWLASVAEGNSVVAGREIGLVELVGQAYGIVGRCYHHLGSAEGRRDMKPFNYLAAATFVPVCLAGAPLAVLLASYFGTSGISRVVSRSLTHSELPIASRSCTARAPQEEPEG